MENSSSLFSAGKVGVLRKPFYFVTVTKHNNYRQNRGDKNEKPAYWFLWSVCISRKAVIAQLFDLKN